MPETESNVTSVRLLVHGSASAAWWQALQQQLPAQAALACASADCPLDGIPCQAVAGDSLASLLQQARTRWPQQDVILLQAGTQTPPRFAERLLAALALDGVLAASPLDDSSAWNPCADAASTTSERIDALCRAYGRGFALDSGEVSLLASAWQGRGLAALDLASLPSGLASLPGRCVRIDTLYLSGSGTRSKPATAPASALGELRQRLAQALQSGDFQPALFGYDGRPVLLHVLHGWGGGAERFVRDLAASDSAHAHLVLLARGNFPRRRFGEVLELYDGSFLGPPLRQLVLPRPIADTALAAYDWQQFFHGVLADYRVDALLVSSLIGHSLDALRSGLPTCVVTHDCYPLWPLLHRDFGDAALPFDAAQLHSDLAAADAEFEFACREPRYWQALRDGYVRAVVDSGATLAAPSRSALANVLRLAPEFGALRQQVIAHGLGQWPQPPAASEPPPRQRLRLLVPGRVRRGKGAELLHAMLPGLREHAELILLGAGAEGEHFFGQRDVHVLLNYAHADLPRLVATLQPDAALILPTVAETFSYTLSECWSLGLPPIATRVGALAERIEDGETGFLAKPDAAALLARIAAIAAAPQQLQRVRARLRTHAPRTLAQMSADYAALLPAAPRSAAPPLRHASPEQIQLLVQQGELAAQQQALQRQAATLKKQTQELDQRAEWASGLDRALRRAQRDVRHHQLTIDLGRSEIDRLVAEGEQRTEWLKRTQDDYSRLETEFELRTRWALNLKTELDLAHGSLSWRLTRPLRYAMRKLRGARARLAFSLTRSRGLLQRMRGSLKRRGLAGTVQRALREFRRGKPPAVAVLQGLPQQAATSIVLPAWPQPQVSIVIPVYNKIAYTLACLASLAQHAGKASFEVIVVDDCSSDDTPKSLADVDGLRVVRNTQNLGFVGSCNAGAAAAHGEFVLFLNNDTVVTPGWLEALLRCFAEQPDAGLVGAKLVYPDGRLQEAGGIVFRDGSGWNYGRFEDPADPRYNFRREADYCSGAAIMLRRSLFEQLGSFDRRYAPAYYEDTDLAFAVRAAGLKVYYEPQSTVVHFEGISAGTDTASGMKRYQVVNQEKFLEKWKDALTRQPLPIDDAAKAPHAASFRKSRRLLIVDACTPTPDQDSGSLRMVNLMRLLDALGWQVTFFSENRLYLDGYTPALQALGVEVLYAPYMNDPIRLFRQRGGEFDAILLSRHYVAINYLGLARLYAPKAKLIFDTVDLHYLREQRAAALEHSEELKRKAERTRAQELKLIRECDATLVVSPVEQALLARELPQARVDILSNVHEVFGCRTAFAERKDLLFVGSFQHPPNEDAMLWFARDIFPLVRTALPEVRLHVIGQPVPQALREFESEHFVLHGFVADLEPFMDGCRISVAPLRYGAGVKGKVNMAMSYGLPVVATTAAVEGMHIQAGSDVLVATDASGFAEAIVRLYDDAALWQTLSANGLANVQRHFSFDAAKKALARILA
ncbi:GT2 family glycosyltransferase [Tahibacter aquaticus]|uniref:GT2 family glycosyltransferase n=2 Tax=Tahibacter aquaticus TaxID=520092 RepID=A0A4R6YWF6_9GAMM|nr:GT2 family glycosyltransferase [Tahibacter aquaticus]